MATSQFTVNMVQHVQRTLVWSFLARKCDFSLLFGGPNTREKSPLLAGKCCLPSSTTFDSFVSPKARINRGEIVSS